MYHNNIDVVNQFKDSYFSSLEKIINNFWNPHISFTDFSFRSVKKNLTTLVLILKYDWFHQFTICLDLIGFDQPGKRYRFTIVYYLLSITYNTRYQFITQTDGLNGVDTLCILYKSTLWSERELWDMYGILVLNHPDLRRLLTDYGFQGFPLRKDFPLTGYQELVYSDFSKNPVYRKVELMQEFRTYATRNPWIKKFKVKAAVFPIMLSSK